ncbi:hypothetical protein JR316_0004159 [Psilocybe cubensis]|uniref:Uncharacterized protein n=1 Tax=Psilocybe cubensis TaxID=181762 RepID=A0ACB8H2I3_PSICU|nr:hypothetical protein JR316_0004159 [Psilocybe cubensis]KAH9482064.1 hypothetical protein JR316_0004159 [Psilocybe cubensis]
MSVPSLTVEIGQEFTVSWTSSNDCSEPQDVDICLNTDTVFIPVGSISRNNTISGTVDITLNSTIPPDTYTLGIRFPGCSFLLAQEFDDFVVVSPTPRVLKGRSHSA